MQEYKIIWTETAKNDLNQIIDYIALEKEDVAKSIYIRIKEKVNSLKIMPNKNRIIPELQSVGIELFRETIDNPWRIMFRISENEVFILLIIDGRRNVEDIIFEKLIRK